MYNSNTQEKIRNIPLIGDIDINRLPQELTRIYAQIVSLRRQAADGSINIEEGNLSSSLFLLRQLSNNLETILLTFPNHEQKESIAFVAATSNSLIYKMTINSDRSDLLLDVDSISPFLAAVVLFLIGNSQADAAEMAIAFSDSIGLNLIEQRLIACVVALATGRLATISSASFYEAEIQDEGDFYEMSLSYLWRELGLGIIHIAKRMTGKMIEENVNEHFDKVIELAVSDTGIFNQRVVFAGPLRLAKLLKILEEDIYNRGLVDIESPPGVDPSLWSQFLETLAEDRPYLWENHKEAINTPFLNPGISAILTLPTGAGKSTLSELKIASCLYSGRKVVYLVPTHALEDQVDKNLRRLFKEYQPENSEYDGEYTELQDISTFPILVMTPERCLTLINIYPNQFEKIGLVVFDEFHLIHGTDIKRDRRSIDAMYCLITLFTLIPKSDYLLISAMVENGKEICDWVSQVTQRQCVLLNSTWKPTRQLHGCVVFEDKDVRKLKEQIHTQRNARKTSLPTKRLREIMSITPHCFFSLKNIWETDDDNDYYKAVILNSNVLLDVNSKWALTSNRNDVAARLGIQFSSMGLKTLVFVDDPKIATSTALKIRLGLNQVNNFEGYTHENSMSIEALKSELGDIKHSYFNDSKSVGVHHGLLLPLERSLMENYFRRSDGAVVLVATPTLAQGVNLPAEIVIIAGDDRFNDEFGFRDTLQPHELLNAAGRAGRAGQASQGAVILIPGDIITINDSVISDRWWQLKSDVFSKGDQCLKIEDPLEYFLDDLQENADLLTAEQINVLYKFKPGGNSIDDTNKLLKNSFYAYESIINGSYEKFESQVSNLIKRRNEIDKLSEDLNWTKEISYKTGVDPFLVLELGNAIDQANFELLCNSSVIEFIDWFFDWIKSDEKYLKTLFTKSSTINQIKRVLGLQQTKEYLTKDILDKIDILREVLKQYVKGAPLNALNALIPEPPRPDYSEYLIKSRNFVIRLVPELSFGFGLLAMAIIEKAAQKGMEKQGLSWDLKALASCIREGFDSSEKLFFKKNRGFVTRVKTHIEFVKAS